MSGRLGKKRKNRVGVEAKEFILFVYVLDFDLTLIRKKKHMPFFFIIIIIPFVLFFLFFSF